jgi:hypothetical protein
MAHSSSWLAPAPPPPPPCAATIAAAVAAAVIALDFSALTQLCLRPAFQCFLWHTMEQ